VYAPDPALVELVFPAQPRDFRLGQVEQFTELRRRFRFRAVAQLGEAPADRAREAEANVDVARSIHEVGNGVLGRGLLEVLLAELARAALVLYLDFQH